jgi:hypothetical protein
MSWVESSSRNFTARHDEHDATDVRGVLELLEDTRERLSGAFPALPTEVAVVVHSSRAALDLAQPFLPVMRRITTPAARRYLAGWAGRGTLHVLAPRLLVERAANVEGSREMLLLTPAALYVQLVVAECNPGLPPPWTARSTHRAVRWAWLVAGAAQWFSGQAALLAAARRSARSARLDLPRPRDRAHRGHMARAPVAAGGTVGPVSLRRDDSINEKDPNDQGGPEPSGRPGGRSRPPGRRGW